MKLIKDTKPKSNNNEASISEFQELLQVPSILHYLKGQLSLLKITHQEDIRKFRKQQVGKVKLFPLQDSKEYQFEIQKQEGKWKISIEDDPFQLPHNEIIPDGLMDDIVGSENGAGLKDIEYKDGGHMFRVAFIRFHEGYISGTLQKTKIEKKESEIGPVIKLSQYFSLSREQKREMLNKYMDEDPEVEEEVFKYFISYILPRSEKLKELIS
jgi:hypothetical protein